jgi:hypothetical protein
MKVAHHCSGGLWSKECAPSRRDDRSVAIECTFKQALHRFLRGNGRQILANISRELKSISIVPGGTAACFSMLTQHFVLGYFHSFPGGRNASFSTLTQSAAADTGLLSWRPFLLRPAATAERPGQRACWLPSTVRDLNARFHSDRKIQ